MRNPQSRLLRIVRMGGVVLSVLMSVCVGFFAQASTPDYHKLFRTILVLAVVDLALIISLWGLASPWIRWGIGLLAGLGFLSFAEMTCRVVFGFRVL
jgi:hypothetical protein